MKWTCVWKNPTEVSEGMRVKLFYFCNLGTQKYEITRDMAIVKNYIKWPVFNGAA